MLHFVGSPCILKRAKYAMTDGGGTATHSEAKSGADGLDPSWILLEQLAVLKRERKLRRAVTFFLFLFVLHMETFSLPSSFGPSAFFLLAFLSFVPLPFFVLFALFSSLFLSLLHFFFFSFCLSTILHMEIFALLALEFPLKCFRSPLGICFTLPALHMSCLNFSITAARHIFLPSQTIAFSKTLFSSSSASCSKMKV